MLLLDEPFSSLDVTTRSSLYGVLRQVSPLVAGPTIYVTHNADDARALAEAAFRIESSTLVRSDSPWEEASSEGSPTSG